MAVSILCYLSVLISPTAFWPVVFLSYAIPGVLVFNVIILIVLAFKRSRSLIIPLIALVLGIPFILISFSYRGKLSAKGSEISVLSFNAKLFRKHNSYSSFSFDMIDWVARDTSQIKCIQEYCSSTWTRLDVTQQVKAQGYYAHTFKSKIKNSIHDLGLATFSRYNIINSGIIWEDSTLNAAIFSDIDLGKDTIRVYNVHLASMGLNLSEFRWKNNYARKIKTLISKLKNGAAKRSSQIDILVTHTLSSPHPYIICGDFNETPYSYNYFRLKSNFYNTFEKAGNGFGFSSNSVLFFLRIDHQFYSSGITPINYVVDRSMGISDHFPTRGNYAIE